MSISGVGSRNTYIYNSRTGKLSSKDGQKDAFVDYFNGDIKGDEDDTLNGFDRARKAEIENLIKTWTQFDSNLLNGPAKEEYEITTEIVDAVTSTVQVDGDKIFTCYSGGFFTYIDPTRLFHQDGPFLTHEHKGYDPSDNSVNIAVGDVFDLGNGYRLRVGEDQVYGEGDGYKNDERLTALAWGLGALIHFAEGQWSGIMLELNDKMASESGRSDMLGGTTPMLLELLRQLGVDTDREFILNGTKCGVRNGKIHEVGDKWGVARSVRDEAIRKYEEEMLRPLSERK
ncbi:MAG: hypothetical protein K2K90_04850 [Lachnospiraceae bacterium]|nr:hypothetical protein [Lachnospiraceae bacterium]